MKRARWFQYDRKKFCEIRAKSHTFPLFIFHPISSRSYPYLTFIGNALGGHTSSGQFQHTGSSGNTISGGFTHTHGSSQSNTGGASGTGSSAPGASHISNVSQKPGQGSSQNSGSFTYETSHGK